MSKESKKDLSLPLELQNLRNDLDNANNFIDYFLEVGLSPEISFNDWLYELSLEELNVIYPDKLKPKIISSFPPFMKRTIAYDESIIKHCFPKGFKIIESETEPNYEVFSFMLDNNFFSIQFPQKYLTCLVCYECMSKYKYLFNKNNEMKNRIFSLNSNDAENNSISGTMSTATISSVLQNNDSENSAFFNWKNKNYYIPKCLMIISLYPFFGEFENILTNLYEYSTRKDITVPIDKFIENYIIEIPVPPRGIFSVEYNNVFDEQRVIKQNLMNKFPLIDVDLRILFNKFSVEDIVDIYRYIFLECRVLFFSNNSSLLNPFIYGLVSCLYPFKYQYQIVTILPKENFETLESITPFLAGINQTYTASFFEEKNLCLSDTIIIVDIDNKKILKVSGELTEENMNGSNNSDDGIPEFPKSCRKTLEKNLHNIVNQMEKNKKKELKELKEFKETFLRYKTSDISKQVRKTSSCSSLSEEKLMLSSEKVLGNTSIQIKSSLPDLLKLNSENKIDYAFNYDVNNAFFCFVSNVLLNYNKYLNEGVFKTTSAPDLQSLFKVNEFLNNVSSSDREFYSKFLTETQIFGDYLYKRMIPKDSNERLLVLPLEEKINEINSSMFNKQPSVFISSNDYAFVNTFSVPKYRECTQNELDYIRNNQNHEILIKYGIIISKTKVDNIDTYYFEYPLFPILATDLFFMENLKDYFIPLKLTEEIEPINADLVSKSHLGKIQLAQSEMSNYIDLSWMILWSMSLWYCDNYEKEERFLELMRVLKKVEHNEMEIYNLLMDALSKYGEDYMVLELYELLIERKMVPSQIIREIVVSVVGKTNFKGKTFLESLKQVKQKRLETKKKRVDPSKFRKRTFKNRYDANILGENITLNAFDICVNCQEEFNLEKLTSNFKDMKRDIIWAICPNPDCQTPIIPKVNIRFGSEMNKFGRLNQNTANVDSIVLFSPQYLKINLCNILVKEYGTKLDVEEFKSKYSALFWNSLWYFKLKHLNYEFILPYEHKINTNVLTNLKNNLGVGTFEFKDGVDGGGNDDDKEDDNNEGGKKKYIREFMCKKFVVNSIKYSSDFFGNKNDCQGKK